MITESAYIENENIFDEVDLILYENNFAEKIKTKILNAIDKVVKFIKFIWNKIKSIFSKNKKTDYKKESAESDKKMDEAIKQAEAARESYENIKKNMDMIKRSNDMANKAMENAEAYGDSVISSIKDRHEAIERYLGTALDIINGNSNRSKSDREFIDYTIKSVDSLMAELNDDIVDAEAVKEIKKNYVIHYFPNPNNIKYDSFKKYLSSFIDILNKLSTTNDISIPSNEDVFKTINNIVKGITPIYAKPEKEYRKDITDASSFIEYINSNLLFDIHLNDYTHNEFLSYLDKCKWPVSINPEGEAELEGIMNNAKSIINSGKISDDKLNLANTVISRMGTVINCYTKLITGIVSNYNRSNSIIANEMDQYAKKSKEISDSSSMFKQTEKHIERSAAIATELDKLIKELDDSADNARKAGVPEKDIVHNKKEIDDYFMH